MIVDYNPKDKNKDFSNKRKYVNSYKNFRRSVVENRNNYSLTNKKNPAIAETENPFTMGGLLTTIIHDLYELRQKVEMLEKNIISQNNDNFIIKEENEIGIFKND